jgi:TatD DNase family protein
MMIRDHEPKTHTPLTAEEKTKCFAVLKDAAEHKVSTIINVGTTLVESQMSIEVAQLSPHIFATVGLHPNSTKKDSWKSVIAEFRNLIIQHPEKVVGVGECGIDKHYPNYNLEVQRDAFRAQIELALEYNLALVVHSRDAAEETLQILDEYKDETDFRGTMHCYSYTPDYARDILKMNFVLGLGGTITYKKNDFLRTVAKETDLSRIVLETDAPFLAPQEHRGQPNKPAYIKNIAEYLAELKNLSFAAVALQTTNNALRLFNITTADK